MGSVTNFDFQQLQHPLSFRHVNTWFQPLFIEACLNQVFQAIISYYLLVSKAGQDLRLTLLHDCTWFYTTWYTRYTRFYAILHHFTWFYLILQYFTVFYIVLHDVTSLHITINHYQPLFTTMNHYYPLSTSWRPFRAVRAPLIWLMRFWAQASWSPCLANGEMRRAADGHGDLTDG